MAPLDIAIIGLACIYPQAPDAATFFRNILEKKDCTSEPPACWGAERFYDPAATSCDRIYTKRGGFIQDFAFFDPGQFGIMPRTVLGSDPADFLCLAVARAALADAGYLTRPFARETCGVILGRGNVLNPGNVNGVQHGLILDQTVEILRQLRPDLGADELARLKRALEQSLPPFTSDNAVGGIPNLVAGRIANRFDLGGPNFTVDAACASSLIALDLGCRELAAGRCDMLLAGGVQANTPAEMYMAFCQLGALSRRGRLRAFDRQADGTLMSEGVAMMVLKRRPDAERDGDRIYALVRGVGTASDGRATSIFAPRLEGELLALTRAYRDAQLAPASVGLVEAHGTGTPLGDRTEIEALTRLFGPRAGELPVCGVGSVKSNIGHALPAAGMAGLIKAVSALHHKILPPTLADEVNPELGIDQTPFFVNAEARPWIHGSDQPRRAGVSAFGFGGINAHAVLEEYQPSGEPAVDPRPDWGWETVVLAAADRPGLLAAAARLEAFLAAHPAMPLRHLAFTLNTGVTAGRGLRLALVAQDGADLLAKLRQATARLGDGGCQRLRDRRGIYFFAEPVGGQLAFLFPGEGSQYPGMLVDLALHFPEIRQAFDQADRVFAAAGLSPLPSQVLLPPPLATAAEAAAAERRRWEIDYAVALVYAANMGLFALLSRLGLTPFAMLGHSSGELAAILAAGAVAPESEAELLALQLELNAIHHRVAPTLAPARLLAVGAPNPALVPELVAASQGRLVVAMDNCAHQQVLCGPPDAIDAASEALKARGAICTFLPFDRPYHTAGFAPAVAAYAGLAQRLAVRPPRTTLYSAATAQPYPAGEAGIREHMVIPWARPVAFRAAIDNLYAAGCRLFVEVGPRANLTGFVDDILAGRPYLAVPANVHTRTGIEGLAHLVAILAAQGLDLDFMPLYARRQVERLDLREAAPARPEAAASTVMALDLCLPRLRLAEPFPLPAGEMATQPAAGQPAAGAAPAQTGRALVMAEYLRSMQQFLDLQRGLMTGLAGGAPLPAAAQPA
ncbi:MAG: type I polyketide synthase, partial [Thermodesulfobacteriota bacterium]